MAIYKTRLSRIGFADGLDFTPLAEISMRADRYPELIRLVRDPQTRFIYCGSFEGGDSAFDMELLHIKVLNEVAKAVGGTVFNSSQFHLSRINIRLQLYFNEKYTSQIEKIIRDTGAANGLRAHTGYICTPGNNFCWSSDINMYAKRHNIGPTTLASEFSGPFFIRQSEFINNY